MLPSVSLGRLRPVVTALAVCLAGGGIETVVALNLAQDGATEVAIDGPTPTWAVPIPARLADTSSEPAPEAEQRLTLLQPATKAGNDALSLTIEGARVMPEFTNFAPRKGEVVLVLSTHWQLNQAPPVDEHHGITPYKLQQKKQLHLVVDGRRLAPVIPGLAGLLKDKIEVPPNADRVSFTAARRQDDSLAPPRELRGEIAFALPAGPWKSLSLHVLDPLHGRFVVPLLGIDPAPGTNVAPYPGAENRVGRVRVHGVDVEPPKNERSSATVSIDLRGTSFCRGEPLDHTGRSEPIAHGFLGIKSGAIHLLFDGEYPVPAGENDLRTPLIWLPDAETGGVFEFSVPSEVLATARRVELVVCPAETMMPGEPIHRPGPLVVPLLTGDLGSEQGVAQAWQVTDDGIEVMGRRVPRLEASTNPNEYELRFQVANVSPSTVQLDLSKLLRIEPQEGKTVPPLGGQPLSLPRPFDVRQALFIPAGARRSVDILYRPRHEPKALHYSGLLREAVFGLDEQGEPPEPAPLPTVDGVAIIDRTRPLGGIESVDLRGQQVNQAIDRGRDWMLSKIAEKFERQGSPHFTEWDLPTMLALVHARAHEEFPDFAEQLQVFLRAQRPSSFNRQGTYRCGVLAMLLDALDDPAHDELLLDVATYLVNTQLDNGTWPYHVDLPAWIYQLAPPAGDESNGLPSDGPLRVVGGPPPGESAGERPGEVSDPRAAPPGQARLRRRVPWISGGGDNSLAQYALLGLYACENQGIAIDRDVWRRSLWTTWRRQGLTGGWAYTSGNPYGSMTCAGATLGALAMRALEPERDPLLDRRLHAGCTWLARFWQVEQNPMEGKGWSQFIYYHYYGVERTARLLDTEFFGPHEWYPLLARRLVDSQTQGGAWPASGGEREGLTTAFAVLVLTRATETLDPVVRAAERAARDERLPKVGQLQMGVTVQKARGAVLVLDASGSMLAPPAGVAEGDRTPKFEYAREALLSVVERLPEGAPTGLVVYGHRKRARDDGANVDVEVVIPVGPLDRARFMAALHGLTARGKTPIALALKESLKALRQAKIKTGTVVLLTDGGQGREPGDPVAAAKALGSAGYRLEIVAFDMDGARSKSMAAWNQQIKSMADVAGGRWISVTEGARLAPTVVATATGEPGLCEVFDTGGEVAYKGPFKGTIELAPGAYTLRCSYGDQPFELKLTIDRGRVTKVEFDAARVTSSVQ